MNSEIKKLGGLIFSLLLPISFVVFWKLHYKMYPQADEAFYKILTQEIYLTAKNEGLIEGLKFAYTHKHWKPILHPIIGTTTLWIANGDIRNSIAIYNLLVYSIFLTLIYFYLSRYIEVYKTAIAVLFLSSIPWVFGLSTNFNSEVGFLTSVVALLLYYSYNPNITTKKNAIGYALLFSLAALLRPVETALLFGVFLIGYLIEMRQKKIISLRPLFISGAWVIYFFAVMSPPYFKMNRDWFFSEILIIFLTSIILFFISLFISRKKSDDFNHVLAISLFFLILLLWYIPGAHQFFDWIMLANFGILAQQTGNRAGRPLINFIYFYYDRLGWTPFILVFIIGFSYLKAGFNFLKNYRLWLFLIGSLFLPFIAGSLSYNGDVRYYYGAWVILMLLLMRTALHQSNPRPKTALFIILTSSVILFTGMMPFLFGEIRNVIPGAIRTKFGHSFYNLYSKNYSAEPIMLTKLEEILDQHDYQYKFFMFFKPYGDINDTPDPFAQTLAAREKGLNWTSEFIGYVPNDENYNFKLNNLKTYDFIMIGPIGDHWKFGTAKWQLLEKNLLKDCKKERKTPDDLKNDFEFKAELEIQNDYKYLGEYCIYKNIRKEPIVNINKFH
jgi:hypothetical protein